MIAQVIVRSPIYHVTEEVVGSFTSDVVKVILFWFGKKSMDWQISRDFKRIWSPSGAVYGQNVAIK